MLLRRFAALSAVLVTSAGLAPAITHADTPPASTLYVNNASGSNCSDSAGLGTQAQPFCTIQAAVNVVNPGQTVSVGQGTYAQVTITRSGTAAAPINIVGAPIPPALSNQNTWIGRLGSNWTGPTIAVNGASYVNIARFGIRAGSASALAVSHSSNITVDRTLLDGSVFDTSAPMVDVTGASSAVTFQRSYVNPVVDSTPVTDIQVEGGSTGTVISTDIAYEWGAVPIVSVNDAPGTDIVSDTLNLTGCQTAVDLVQGSQNSVIENNDIEVGIPSSCKTPPAVVTVDSTAAPTATNDYNILVGNGTDYSWGGNNYAAPARLSAATGQGVHDLDFAGSATPIDSANSAAPGELSTDVYGMPRVDDPLVANTGAGPFTYYDRGATEAHERLSIGSYTVSATQAPTGGAVTFTATAVSAWTKTPTYVFDFGDGTTPVSNTTGVATHVYATTGTFTTSVDVTGVTDTTGPLTRPITIVPPAPLVAAMSVWSASAMTAKVTQQSYDSWNITGYVVDFGDGTQPVRAPAGTPQVIHSYAKLGTYTITLTSKDAGGNQASTSQKFTTAGSAYTPYGPVRVLDTRHGIGTGGVVAKLGAGQTLKLKIAGNGAIPANVSAVAFNLTVTNPSAGGYVTASPDDILTPTTSNLNFTAGQTKATSVIVAVGPDGGVSLYNGSGGTVDLVADVNGYFTRAEAQRYTPSVPDRILDTRQGTGTGGVVAKLGAGQTLTLSVFQPTQVQGISAVALNLTAADEAAGGYVTAYPDGSPRPPTSSLNFGAGQIVPNTVIVPVGGDEKIDLYNGSGGPIDLVGDLEGYFTASGADAYVPVSPQRLCDSRKGAGPLSSSGNTSVHLQPLGANPEIDPGLSSIAYTFNVTVTQTVGSGFVTVYPANLQSVPNASNVNFTSGQTTANSAIAASGPASADDIFAATFNQPASSTQLIVDLFGFFSAE